MNEAVSKLIPAFISGALAAIVVYLAVKFGKRGTQTDSSATEELERRAAADNRTLAEAERGTRETLERARETNRDFDRIVGEQTEDNKRAAENNRSAAELIKRAEEILES